MSDPSAERIPPEPLPPPLPPRGRPLLATLIGALVMLLPLAGPQEAAAPKYNLADMIGTLLGYAIFALVIWGVLYAITVRRASRRWKLASLIVLMTIGLVDGFISIGRAPATAEIEKLPGLQLSPGAAPKI